MFSLLRYVPCLSLNLAVFLYFLTSSGNQSLGLLIHCVKTVPLYQFWIQSFPLSSSVFFSPVTKAGRRGTPNLSSLGRSLFYCLLSHPFFLISPSPPGSLLFRYKPQILGTFSLTVFRPISMHGQLSLDPLFWKRRQQPCGRAVLAYMEARCLSPHYFHPALHSSWPLVCSSDCSSPLNNNELVPSCSLCPQWNACCDAWGSCLTWYSYSKPKPRSIYAVYIFPPATWLWEQWCWTSFAFLLLMSTAFLRVSKALVIL